MIPTLFISKKSSRFFTKRLFAIPRPLPVLTYLWVVLCSFLSISSYALPNTEDTTFAESTTYNLSLPIDFNGVGTPLDINNTLIVSSINAPTDIQIDGGNTDNVNENRPVGTRVGILTTSDLTLVDAHTYTLVSGAGDTDNNSFTITDDELITNAIFDFETKTSYSIRIRTTDSYNNFYEKAFTITINDITTEVDASGIKVWNLNTSEEYMVSDAINAEIIEGIARIKNIPNLVHAGAISDDANTVLAGATGIAVVGIYAYVASGDDDGVQILHIYDPTNPIPVGSITDDGSRRLNQPYDITVVGDYAYVTAFQDDGVEILYIGGSNPTHVGAAWDFGSYLLNGARGIAVVGNYAYVASFIDDGVQILDISNPSNVNYLGYIADGGSRELDGATDIAVVGNYAYVTGYLDDGVQILDISNPANPMHVGSITDDTTTALNRARQIAIDGNYAYVTAEIDDGVQILDISNPANPIAVGSITDDTTTALDGARGIAIDGSYAYVTGYNDDGVQILDISDPTNPIAVGSITDSGTTELDGASHIVVVGDIAYVTGYVDDGVEILRILSEYSNEKPYITPATAQAFALTVDSFTETLAFDNQGSVSYQVSTDGGSTWHYWNGSAWTTTTQTDGTQTSSATVINTNIASLDTDGGNFTWRAYLESDGSQKGELDHVAISFIVVEPEIEVSSSEGGTLTDDGTDAQGSEVVGASKTVTYTVTNSGTATLTLTGTASITSLNNISGTPTVSAFGTSSLTANSSTTFTISYTPSGTGAFSFVVSITNDDIDKNPFNFTVSGTAITPEIEVSSSEGGTLNDGGTDAQGSEVVGASKTVTYTVTNSGTAKLTLTGTASITNLNNISGTPTVTAYASTSVSTGTSTTFEVTYIPDCSTNFSFDISIANDDADENPFNFTVSGTASDTTAPATPAMTTITAQCSTTVGTPTAIDNCSGVVTGTTSNPTTISSQGTHTILWTFTDAVGNSSTATQTVVIQDTTAPVPLTLTTITAQCSTTVTTPTATDNCSGVFTGTTSNPTTISSQGTHTILWTFTDAAGNSSTATQTVVILQDTTAPATPAMTTITAQCSTTVGTPTAMDNCSGVVTGTTSDPTTISSQGTHTILWTFTDAAGNSSTATQTVVILQDTTAPATPTLTTITAQYSTTVVTPTAMDNCSGVVTGTTSDPTTISSQGTHTILWIFTDAAGNSSQSVQIIVIEPSSSGDTTGSSDVGSPPDPPEEDPCEMDTQAPVVPSLLPIKDSCRVELEVPTAEDNCSGTVTGVTSAPLTYEQVGSYTVTWTFTDAAGNSSTATQTVVIQDTTAPATPAMTTITAQCSTTVGTPTAMDNCSGVVTGTTSDPTTISSQGTHTILWTFTDAAGNSSSAVQQVIIDYDQELTDTQEACDSFEWIDGVVYTDSNNTATFETTDEQSCTTLHRLDLTIYTLPDTAVRVEGNTLSAVQAGVQYQWVDCENGNTPIAGATQQSFTPTGIKGSYAVQITTAEGCTLTSDCIPYFDTSTLLVAEGISPNGDGVNDTWVIQGIENHPSAMIYVYNKTGEVVFSALNGYNNDWIGDWKETGRTLPSAPYFYTIDRDADGKIDNQGWLYIQN